MTEKVSIDGRLCKGCGLCLTTCPRQVFQETEGVGALGFRLIRVASPEKCTSCGLCELFCAGAISLNPQGVSGNLPSGPDRSAARGGWRRVPPLLPPGKYFLTGNEAIVEGALSAGCRFFAGYPITPANEILERIVKRMAEIGAVVVQAEDEIAAIGMVLGASWAGAKAMTATSGPGFALMQENLSLADMTETPCVIVDVQRAGPSTGQPTRPAAMDMREVRWGSHGGVQRIVLYPESAQECYSLMVEAFNLSEKFRVPVILLSDAYLAHLSESLEIGAEVEIFDRRYLPAEAPFGPTVDLSAPSMPKFGDGECLSVTGSTHDRWGVRSTADPDVQEALVSHLQNKIAAHRDELTDYESLYLEDAEVVLVGFGTVSRSIKWAIKEAREGGMRVGFLRPRIVYPFPVEVIQTLSANVQRFVVPEMNQGQMFYVVRERTSKEVVSLAQPSGQIIDPRRILRYLREGVW